MILNPKCRNAIDDNELPLFVLNEQKLMLLSKFKYLGHYYRR